MHFLAHVYLSGNTPSILVGNFIGEIKTITDPSTYVKEIRDGISLHQLIDDYTNGHPAVLRSRKRLNPKYSKYSDTIIDVFYDHFLAANWSEYSDLPLEKFALNAYRTLLEHQAILPYKAKCMLPHMIKGNWLARFTTLGGVNQVINEMDIKSTKLTHIVLALEDLISNYSEFKQDFDEYFPHLMSYIKMANQQVEVHESKPSTLAWVG
jgi:acyl carrier protein phosphodiesterase